MLTASSVKGSQPGTMTCGPLWNFVAPAIYKCDLYLRARSPHHTATSLNDRMTLPSGSVATLEIRDQGHSSSLFSVIDGKLPSGWLTDAAQGSESGLGSDCGALLASRVLTVDDFANGNHWSLITLDFTVENALNAIDIRLKWHGNAALDVASVIIR